MTSPGLLILGLNIIMCIRFLPQSIPFHNHYVTRHTFLCIPPSTPLALFSGFFCEAVSICNDWRDRHDILTSTFPSLQRMSSGLYNFTVYRYRNIVSYTHYPCNCLLAVTWGSYSGEADSSSVLISSLTLIYCCHYS